MIQKMKRAFGIFFSFLWISLLASLCNVDYESMGGLEINGYLCVLFWLIFIFLMVKVSAKLADIGFLILYLFLRFYKFGIDERFASGISYIILVLLVFFVIDKKIK